MLGRVPIFGRGYVGNLHKPCREIERKVKVGHKEPNQDKRQGLHQELEQEGKLSNHCVFGIVEKSGQVKNGVCKVRICDDMDGRYICG